ncbi:MAG TPA: archease [Pseudonocardia sp.]|jgi:SHS2 domain-containing protein|uniref:archease n=1 Tax=Pseudonocardia sp. TaxID=60912 RepID=UPI002B4AB236|nr:archease [Pseudonocardia sp.]HLU60513.1 archease [Pseudonocardia sp.]
MTARGHRAVEHTADVRVEAWGPTREDCLAEAVAGLVATFADTAGAAPMETITTRLDATADADLLAAVLDEVIYLLDAHSVVPCGAELTPGPTGVELRLRVAPVGEVEVIGAAPKAVTLNDLRCEPRDDGWWCAATIDV